ISHVTTGPSKRRTQQALQHPAFRTLLAGAPHKSCSVHLSDDQARKSDDRVSGALGCPSYFGCLLQPRYSGRERTWMYARWIVTRLRDNPTNHSGVQKRKSSTGAIVLARNR